MGTRVNRFGYRVTVAAALLTLVASPAAAATWLDTVDGRWLPSLSMSGGATFQEQLSAVESNCLFGGFGDGVDFPDCAWVPTLPRGPAPLRPRNRGSDWAVSPFVAMSLGVMTPALPEIPYVPVRLRFFLSGELIAFFPPKRSIASEGDPSGEARVPENSTNQQTSAIGLQGVGSRTKSEIRTGGYGANFGIAIPVKVRGYQLMLKPSAAWMQFKVDIKGKVQAGLKDDFDPLTRPPYGSNLRQITLRDSESITTNALGPALEIELDTGMWGPIGSSVYIFGAAYKVLGDTKVDLEDEVSFLPPTTDGIGPDIYQGRWRWEQDPWIGRIGVGFRIHLVPR